MGLGWASILVPLALGFGFSLLLAYQAFDSGRRHRATARAAARDHTQFAAYLIASSIDGRMREALLYGFYPVDLALGRDGEPLLPPEALRAEPEASRCETPASERHVFRYDPRADEVVVDGSHEAELEAWVRATLAADDGAETRPFPHAVADLGGQRRWFAYRRWGERYGGVVYGFATCWRTREGNVFERAAAATQAFSPTLVGATPNDSLFALAARDEDGELVYGDGWTRPEAELYGAGDYYGTVDLEPAAAYGGVRVRVMLLPRVVGRLVDGGMPRSRLPLALGLVSLNGILMWLAVRQLRRGHELVSLRAGFVRNISHELRTPLQQILLFTELLRSGRLGDAAKRAEALEIMHTETRRLIELVRNVLRFSGSPEEELRLSDIDLAVVVRETVEAFRPLAAGRRAEIEIEERSRPEVVADEDALKRVLINLLDNAVKYGPEGQRIRVDVDGDGSWGEVSVVDEGPGIPPADRERVWEAFRRLDREESGASAGSGIGLSIVRPLVHAMDGRVTVQSGAAGGARFVVKLPIGPATP